MTAQKTLVETLKGVVVKMSVRRVSANPHMRGSEGMDHWRVTLTCGHDTMRVYYSQGHAYTGQPPKLENVLDCLASDACGFDNARTFEAWASEYGYDTDSRDAERIYKVVAGQAGDLKRLLGPSLYTALLYDTERP